MSLSLGIILSSFIIPGQCRQRALLVLGRTKQTTDVNTSRLSHRSHRVALHPKRAVIVPQPRYRFWTAGSTQGSSSMAALLPPLCPAAGPPRTASP